MNTKTIKARNPEGVEATTSGDRPHIPNRPPNYHWNPNEKPSKGESAHTPEHFAARFGDWYLAPGSGSNEYFLIVAGHSVAKIRTSNKRVLDLIEAAPETAAERDKLIQQVDKLNVDLIGARLERGEMRKQRDELLAACKDAAQFINDNHSLLANVKANAMDCQLRAAIKHASEGK